METIHPNKYLLKYGLSILVLVILMLALYLWSSSQLRPTSLIDPRYEQARKQLQLIEFFHQFNISELKFTPGTEGSIAEILFSLSATLTDIDCEKTSRIGSGGDGGWGFCQSGKFDIKAPCLVYSFGINNDWSFDDDVVAKYGCQVRAFDPSMKVESHQRGKNIWFYNEGVAGADTVNDKKWKLKSLKTFLKQFNETNTTIDYLKMDVEYCEWETLEAALTDGSLSRVKQLGVEVHTHEIYYKTSTIQEYQLYMRVLRGLYNAGFRKWHSHLNPSSITHKSTHSGRLIMCCFEFIYINVNFLK